VDLCESVANFQKSQTMLTADENAYILEQAYVPEHCVGLITRVSGGEPFLVDDFFVCLKNSWAILIGYPLDDRFTIKKLEAVVARIRKKFNPDCISLIAPELPASFASDCREKETDTYYTLETRKPVVGGALQRNLKKARRQLRVESSPRMQAAHRHLMQEFIERAKPPERVERLLFKMPEFVAGAEQAFVLNAWDSGNNLCAFYVVDLEALRFSNYIIGCHSKKNYILGASDLLLFELIDSSLQNGKHYIHLGLGVNAGVRRFKEKWGAVAARRYEMCELAFKKPSILSTILALGKSS
jgi:hypothetical protein